MPRTRRKTRAVRWIAERRFVVRGLRSSEVVVRIGMPEAEGADSRCPFQVIGLSTGDVQYAYGVDSLQALNLALVGARNSIRNDVRVLSRFHRKLSLKFSGESWDLSFPIWAHVAYPRQLKRLETFLDDLWSRKAVLGRSAGRGRARRR